MIYDTVIIGGGIAGITAGIYASRFGMKSIILEKDFAGGQINISSEIENYPGYSGDGPELAAIMQKQVMENGVDIESSNVKEIQFIDGAVKRVCGDKIYEAKTLILAGGARVRKLGAEGETRFIGRGMSYCAVCDGMFFKNKNVAVIGGGNTAFEDAEYLSKICKAVYLIHRRNEFRAEKRIVERVKLLENVQIITNGTVKSINGDKKVESITVIANNEEVELKADGIFAAIGRTPDTDFLQGQIDTDKGGYIITNERMETNVKGVYAAGDIRTKPLRQLITAAADGAVAADTSNKYVLLQ